MSKPTKRPPNKCEDCGYKWYPRGHKRSKKCPECGGPNVKIDWVTLFMPIVIPLILFLSFLIYVFTQ